MSDDKMRPEVFPTARQWELAHGQRFADWLHSGNVAMRMLADVTAGVETTVEWIVGDDQSMARRVITEFPQVLNNCDLLAFDTPEQALAYLVVHLPYRYCRTSLVLERLLVQGALPLGKTDNFAAIDIGAGPGPGIFAIRSFYAALAHYAGMYDPSWRIATVGYSHVVERSSAMPWVMHRFAEALIMVERGNPNATGSDGPVEPNPCINELGRSQTPFGADYADFSQLNLREEYNNARQRQVRQLYDDAWLDLSWSEASQLGRQEPAERPSGYALAVMMNFLTTTDAVSLFSEAIERLMRGSLVPGGTILVLGATEGKYELIYKELDRRARVAGLTVLDGFDGPLQAGGRDDEGELLSTLSRTIWNKLENLAGDVGQIKQELWKHGAADIFDESKPYRLPPFRMRAYRRGK